MDARDIAGTKPSSRLKRRRLVFRLLVVTLALALAVGLCEAFLWIVCPVRYHEWLIWEAEPHIGMRPVPNQLLHTAAGHPIQINQHGFRGPDHTFEKPPGTLRIAVFGGSAAFCFHAAGRERTWPGALEVKLQHGLAMPVEVINFALPGFNSFKSKISYLCFGRSFQPDAIIVYHTWNDLAWFRRLKLEPYRPVAWVPSKPLWQRIARETQIGRRARNFLWAVTRRRMHLEFAADERTGVRYDEPVAAQAFAWQRQNFEDLVILARHDGVLPILVSQAALGTLENMDDPEIRDLVAEAQNSAGMTLPLFIETWLAVSSIIEEVATTMGAVFVDGYAVVPHDLLHLRDQAHLHDAGSELLAGEIARVLLQDQEFMGVVQNVRAEVLMEAD